MRSLAVALVATASATTAVRTKGGRRNIAERCHSLRRLQMRQADVSALPASFRSTSPQGRAMMFPSGGPASQATTKKTWPDLTGGNHDAINAVGRAGERGTSNDGSRPERGRAQERPQDACRRADLRHGLQPPTLQPAHADQQAER